MKSFFYTVLLFFNVTIFCQAQVYVDANATGSNDGTSWTDAYNDLQSALSLTESSEIWIASGTYYPSMLDTATYFKFEAGHTLYGSLPSGATSISESDLSNSPTIIDGDINGDDTDDIFENKGDNALHLMYIPDALENSSIDGVMFRSGTALMTNDNDESNFQLRGGAIYALSNLSLNNCVFEKNQARSGGGVYLLQATEGSITNCTFNNNAVDSQAGGIMLAACQNILVSNCLFENNSVNRGALYTFESVDCRIERSNFLNNTVIEGAFGSGGYFSWQSINIEMVSCMFDGNTSSSAGAIYLDGRNVEDLNQLTLDSCTIVNNTAASFGAGLYVFEGQATVMNSSFENNTGDNAGAMYLDSSKVSISSTFILNNTSANFGGGIYAFMGEYNLSDVVISGNSAENGAGSYFRLSSFDATNCAWNNNIANTSADEDTPFGAGAFISGCTYTFDNCDVSGNISEYSAGGIFNSNSIFEIENSTFTGNLGTFGGASANYNIETNGMYRNCQFISNRANTSGGAGSVGFLAQVAFEDCMFIQNMADFGGALFVQNDSTTLNVINSDFNRNSCANNGGAVSSIASTNVGIFGCDFSSNQGNVGGALFYSADSLRYGQLRVDKTIFAENTAFNQGGAININNANDVEIKSSLMYSNVAQSGAGGAIINNAFDGLNSEITLINNTIADNESTIGAGIAHFQDDSSLGNIIFLNNILFNFNGLDYEVEEGSPSAESRGGNLTVYQQLADIFNMPSDDLQVDPSFVNQFGRDYRLNDSSPVINAGVNLGAHESDLEGNPIVGDVDKGCYENQLDLNTFDLPEVQGIRIVSNPVVDQLNFQIENNYVGAFRVMLLNSNGQIVARQQFQKSSIEELYSMNTTTLSSGNYFVVFNIGKGISTRVMIVE